MKHVKYINEAFDKDTQIWYNQQKVNSQYFIDRTGKIIKLDTKNFDLSDVYNSIHHEIGIQQFPNVSDPKKYMMSLGWIMVGSSVYSVPICDKMPSNLQLNTLKKLNLLNIFSVYDKDINRYVNYEKYIMNQTIIEKNKIK